MNAETQRPIVAKFGGTSMATADSIRQAGDIVRSNTDRRGIVVSAPGKRNAADTKVTDLLLACNRDAHSGVFPEQPFQQVADRFEGIGKDLSLHTHAVGWLSEVYDGIKNGEGRDWTASRGEWMMGKLFSRFLGGEFVDAKDVIHFGPDDSLDPLSYSLIQEQLSGDKLYVVPGFYGKGNDGSVKVFPRGGSDITGAIIARGVGATLYENWTDVDGVRSANPHEVLDPKAIGEITSAEMRELAYHGAEVLHMGSIRTVLEAGIPINLRNTFNPDHPGTMVVEHRISPDSERIIAVVGRGGFASFQIMKYDMNEQRGALAKITKIFDDNDVAIDHMPTGIDDVSVLCRGEQFDSQKVQRILKQIRNQFHPDRVSVADKIALVSVVGKQIATQSTSIQRQVYQALEAANIDTNVGIHSLLGNSLVLSVPDKDMSRAINALYDTFIK